MKKEIEKEILEKELRRLSNINDELEKKKLPDSNQSILANALAICEITRALKYYSNETSFS